MCNSSIVNLMNHAFSIISGMHIVGSIITVSVSDQPNSAIIMLSSIYYLLHLGHFCIRSNTHKSLNLTEHYPYLANFVMSCLHIIIVSYSLHLTDLKMGTFYPFTFIYNIVHLICYACWFVYSRWNSNDQDTLFAGHIDPLDDLEIR